MRLPWTERCSLGSGPGPALLLPRQGERGEKTPAETIVKGIPSFDVPEDRLSSSYRRKPVSIPWIPAFAGMTMGGAGMTTGKRGYDDGEARV